MYVIAQSVMFPSVSDLPLKKLNIIQATLIFDLPAPQPEAPVEVSKEKITLPVEPEEKINAAKIPGKDQVAITSEPEVLTISPLPQASPHKRREEVKEVKEVKEEQQEKSEQDENANNITLSDKNTIPTANLEMVTPTSNMAKRHLNGFNHKQQNKLAAMAAENYQVNKNSPVLNSRVKNPFFSEDEEFRDRLKVRANCNGAFKKSTAVVLGFLGGQVNCSKPPDFDSFIQSRLNKDSQSPERYADKISKRPQPVVIKE
jgi:hypothetical protein